jgi:hypothetical protein
MTGIGKAQLGGAGGGVYSKLHLVIPVARVRTLGSNPLTLLPGIPNTRIILDEPALFSLVNPTIDYTLGSADTLGIFTNLGAGPTGSPYPSGDPMEAQIPLAAIFQTPYDLNDQGVFQNQTTTPRIAIGASMYLATFQIGVGGANVSSGDGPLIVDINYEYVPAAS